MPKSNITGLIEHGKVRTELTEKKVMTALNTLRREGETINIAKVAKNIYFFIFSSALAFR